MADVPKRYGLVRRPVRLSICVVLLPEFIYLPIITVRGAYRHLGKVPFSVLGVVRYVAFVCNHCCAVQITRHSLFAYCLRFV